MSASRLPPSPRQSETSVATPRWISSRSWSSHATSGGRIAIEIKKLQKTIRVAVRDNGCGFSPDVLRKVGYMPLVSKHGGGTGLYNVNQRLIRLLGEEARLRVHNLDGGGSEVFFHIPHRNAEESIN